jgi:hypothetical protein
MVEHGLAVREVTAGSLLNTPSGEVVFAGDDFGKAILIEIADKHVSPTNWVFEYGEGDDHREWTAWINTIAGAEYAIEPVVEALGGGIDIECN